MTKRKAIKVLKERLEYVEKKCLEFKLADKPHHYLLREASALDVAIQTLEANLEPAS